MTISETKTVSRIYLSLNCLFNDEYYTVLLHLYQIANYGMAGQYEYHMDFGVSSIIHQSLSQNSAQLPSWYKSHQIGRSNLLPTTAPL